MIDKIYEKALKQADAVEILYNEIEALSLNIYNFKETFPLVRHLKGVCLRVIKNGKLGWAYASLPSNIDKLIDEALRSAMYGPRVNFDFPSIEEELPALNIYDEKLAEVGIEELLDSARYILGKVRKAVPEIMLNMFIEREIRTVRLINSSSFDRTYKKTRKTETLIQIFPGSKEGIYKESVTCKNSPYPEYLIEELIDDYNATLKPVEVPTKKMDVILRPSALWSFYYRLLTGVNGKNILKGISPLKDKLNEQIFSELLNIYDDPWYDWAPKSCPFDDEGVVTYKKPVVEKGVLKTYIYDLFNADKAETKSTGNGFKRYM